MFMNDPDYVPSVFVFSNATSDKDKRSRYERLRKRIRGKGARGRQSLKCNHLVADEVPWRLSVSPQAQTPNDLIEQTTNNELHANDSTCRGQ